MAGCPTSAFFDANAVLDSASRSMKKTKALAVFLVLAGLAFVAYRLSDSPQPTEQLESPQTSVPQCDQGLWEHVYNPRRLQVLDPCISVTGTVDSVKEQADGDYHVLFLLDQEFEPLLNEKNLSRQRGLLVLEPICQGKITQANARRPCSGYAGPYFLPEVGQRYLVTGTYVYDTQHGWNELHPVTSMQPIQ